MKKSLLLLVITVTIINITNASYTGDVSDYYNQHKSQRTIYNNTQGAISMTSAIIGNHPVYNKTAQYYDDNVICRTGGEECYTASTAMRAFSLDVEAFTKGYTKVTGIIPVFTNLYDKLFVQPSFSK